MTIKLNYQTSALDMSSPGSRIYVPYSTDAADRLNFQTSYTDQATLVCAAPSGTNDQAWFQMLASPTFTNCSVLSLDVRTVSSTPRSFVTSSGHGTYSTAKLRFNMDSYPSMTVGTTGKVGIGLQDETTTPGNTTYPLNICSGGNLGAAQGSHQYYMKMFSGVDNGTSFSVNADSRAQLMLYTYRTVASGGGSGDWVSQSSVIAYVVDGSPQSWIDFNANNTEGVMRFITNTPSARWNFRANTSGATGALLYFVTARANNTAWNGMVSYSSITTSPDVEFYVRGDGNAWADAAFNPGGADYAEMFEWEDQNPTDEDRRGLTVVTVGEYIRPATEQDSSNLIIGVVSAIPAAIGDDPLKWKNKYLRDEYGVEMRDANGDRIPNPEFDSEQEYVKRSDRKEWDAVGLVGKIYVRKGQPVNPRWKKVQTGEGTKPDCYLVR